MQAASLQLQLPLLQLLQCRDCGRMRAAPVRVQGWRRAPHARLLGRWTLASPALWRSTRSSRLRSCSRFSTSSSRASSMSSSSSSRSSSSSGNSKSSRSSSGSSSSSSSPPLLQLQLLLLLQLLHPHLLSQWSAPPPLRVSPPLQPSPAMPSLPFTAAQQPAPPPCPWPLRAPAVGPQPVLQPPCVGLSGASAQPRSRGKGTRSSPPHSLPLPLPLPLPCVTHSLFPLPPCPLRPPLPPCSSPLALPCHTCCRGTMLPLQPWTGLQWRSATLA